MQPAHDEGFFQIIAWIYASWRTFLFLGVAVTITLWVLAWPLYRLALKDLRTVLLVWVGSFLVGIVAIVLTLAEWQQGSPRLHLSLEEFWYLTSTKTLVAIYSRALFFLFAAALSARLYGKWKNPADRTDKERSSGIDSVYAWLSPMTLVLCVLTSTCAALAGGPKYGVLVLLMTLGASVAYPIFNSAPSPSKDEEDEADDTNLAAARERVLNMLEAGTVSAAESAELLHALSEPSSPKQSTPPPATRGRKFILCGGALLLIGFFLPWFRINVGAELKRALGGSLYTAQSVSAAMQSLSDRSGIGGDVSVTINGQPAQGLAGMPAFPTAQNINALHNLPIEVNGGDIGRGLGWIVLLLGLAAALHPYLITTRLSADALHKSAFICLGIGAFILIYLLSQSFRFAAIGLFLAIIGFALEIAGQVIEGKQP